MKLTRKGYFIILGFILVLILSGAIYAYISSPTIRHLVSKLFSSTPTPNPTTSITPTPNPSPSSVPTPAITDTEIKLSVLQAIMKNSEWRKNEIDVQVNNGNVELKGFVFDKNQPTQIEQFIRSINGVKKISALLEVKTDTTLTSVNPATPSPSPTKSPETSNETLAKEVEFACYKTDAFEIKTMKFSAEEGQITLSGKVRSRAEKLLAERIAKEVQGVKSVTNDLEIK